MESQLSTQPTVPKRILVGLDGSSGSGRALDWAIQVAKLLEAEIVAVYVLELLSPTAVAYGLAPIALPDGWLDDLRRQFENEWSAPLKEAGIRYRTVFETGAQGPAPTLIAVGTEDTVAGSAPALAAIIPGAQAFDIPGRDHMLAVGDKLFKAAVLQFLDRRP